LLLLTLVVATAPAPPARTADARLPRSVAASAVGPDKRTLLGLYLTSREAAAALAAHPDIVLIDVRSRDAVLAQGLAEPTTRNIPLFAATRPEIVARHDAAARRINPAMLALVEALVGAGPQGRTRTIVVICPDGSHSALAVDYLADNGFSNVYLIVDGITGRSDAAGDAIGWRRAGLPWLKTPRPDQLSPL
jgi:rhodanese-related sulfurtransferase